MPAETVRIPPTFEFEGNAAGGPKFNDSSRDVGASRELGKRQRRRVLGTQDDAGPRAKVDSRVQEQVAYGLIHDGSAQSNINDYWTLASIENQGRGDPPDYGGGRPSFSMTARGGFGRTSRIRRARLP